MKIQKKTKGAKEEMKVKANRTTLEAVHTHTHTHTQVALKAY